MAPLQTGLGSGSISGLKGLIGLDQIAKLARLARTTAVCSAFGLNVGTNAPSAIYLFNETGSPILNQVSTPTADLDTNLGTGLVSFQVAGPTVLTLDKGVEQADNTTNGIRCSATSENDVALQSLAVCQLVYIPSAVGGARGFCAKKGGTSAAAAGYGFNSNTTPTRNWRIADGTTQNTLTTRAQIPTGWNLWLGTVDRNAIQQKLFVNFESAQSQILTSLLTYTNATTFRPGNGNGQNSAACFHFFVCVWTDTAAEGITQTHYDMF